jgi:predicted flap endonuclease-1-like 5' DNA nuclease
MNQTGAGAPDVTAVITTAHLVLIVVLAIAALLVIWWGGRRRRERGAAKAEALERRERADEAAVSPPAAPIPTVAPPVSPAPPPIAPAPLAHPGAPGLGDLPVTALKGLGPRVAARLGELGISRVDQLAALSPGEAETLDGELGAFSGRMARDRWIEQAQLLAAGDSAGFEAKFGKLG